MNEGSFAGSCLTATANPQLLDVNSIGHGLN